MSRDDALPAPVMPPETRLDSGAVVPTWPHWWQVGEWLDERETWIPPAGTRIRKFGDVRAPGYC